jgi:hypothetical protein
MFLSSVISVLVGGLFYYTFSVTRLYSVDYRVTNE